MFAERRSKLYYENGGDLMMVMFFIIEKQIFYTLDQFTPSYLILIIVGRAIQLDLG